MKEMYLQNYLVENYNISPISTPEEDLKKILG